MITKEQLADEQRKEREFNRLSETVISVMPFGKFYGLMRGASSLLTNNLPKSVGIDESGRPIVVYKKDITKVIGTFAVPAHEWMGKEFAKGDWKAGIASVFTGGFSTMAKNIQQQKRAKFFDISPEEVQDMYAKKNLANQKSNIPENKDTNKRLSSERTGDKFLGMPKAVGITVAVVGGLALVVGGIFLVRKLRK